MAQVYKVRMTEILEFFLKADSEEQAQEWMETHPLQEARAIIGTDTESNDQVLCPVYGYEDIDISEED